MASQVPNDFTSYTFTEEELANAKILNPLQQMYLQTRLSEKAMQKVSLKVDSKNIESFLQEEAYLQGQIEFIQELLSQ